MADAAQERRITFPGLSESQKAQLRRHLGPMVALDNPLDYHTFIWNNAASMGNVFRTMLDGEAALGCLIADFPRSDRCDPSAWNCLIEAGGKAARVSDTPLALVATIPETLPEEASENARQAGMIPMHGLDDTLTAIEGAAFIGLYTPLPDPLLLPGSPRESQLLSEAAAKEILRDAGIEVPKSRRVESRDALAEAASQLTYPLALKCEGAAHKSEVGGVALNLCDLDAVFNAARAMPADSFLLEEMVDTAVAELLIGVIRDPAHGFVLTVGAGGILTELAADTTSLLLPASPHDIENALSNLRIAPLLRGYRGRPAAAIEAIVSSIIALGFFVERHRDSLDEVEINPLICTPTNAVAADALIKIGIADD